jgi:hypothetical protein
MDSNVIHPLCATCVYNVNGCAVNLCAVVRMYLRGEGIEVFPQWKQVLVPIRKENAK